MATVIVVGQQSQAPVSWNNELCDCCGAPGGAGTCCYAFFCSACAAGDVATAAGKDYCCSCCIPILVGLWVPIYCCVWSQDRQALAQRYNVNDPHQGCACCMFIFCCTTCMLAQELNHIAVNQGKPNNTVVIQQQVIPMPQQQVMGGYPAGPPPQYAQQPQYAPQQGGFAPPPSGV